VILFQRSFVDLCVMFYCGHDCVDVRCVCVADLVGEICMALKKRKRKENASARRVKAQKYLCRFGQY
jgi:hypothetical protein